MNSDQKSLIKLSSSLLLLLAIVMVLNHLNLAANRSKAETIVQNTSPNGFVNDFRPNVTAKINSPYKAESYTLFLTPHTDGKLTRNIGERSITFVPHSRLPSNTNYKARLNKVFLKQYVFKNDTAYYRENSSGGWSAWTNTNPENLIQTVGSGPNSSCFNSNIQPNGKIQQHFVRNGNLYSRQYDASNQNFTNWVNATDDVSSVGSGNITCLNTYTDENGYIRQHLVKGGKVWLRINTHGWSNWIEVTSDTSRVGVGTVTAFSMYRLPEGYNVQHITRGGKVWRRDNKSGWSTWLDVTSDLHSVSGQSRPNDVITGFVTELIYDPNTDHLWDLKTPQWTADTDLLNQQDTSTNRAMPFLQYMPRNTDQYTATYSGYRKMLLTSDTLTNTQLEQALPSLRTWLDSKGKLLSLYPHTFEFDGK